MSFFVDLLKSATALKTIQNLLSCHLKKIGMYECETCQVAKCGSFINDVGRFQNGHKNAIPWDPVDPVKEGKELDLEDYDYEISDDDDEVRNLQTWNTGLIERKGMKNSEKS